MSSAGPTTKRAEAGGGGYKFFETSFLLSSEFETRHKSSQQPLLPSPSFINSDGCNCVVLSLTASSHQGRLHINTVIAHFAHCHRSPRYLQVPPIAHPTNRLSWPRTEQVSLTWFLAAWLASAAALCIASHRIHTEGNWAFFEAGWLPCLTGLDSTPNHLQRETPTVFSCSRPISVHFLPFFFLSFFFLSFSFSFPIAALPSSCTRAGDARRLAMAGATTVIAIAIASATVTATVAAAALTRAAPTTEMATTAGRGRVFICEPARLALATAPLACLRCGRRTSWDYGLTLACARFPTTQIKKIPRVLLLPET